MHAARLRLELSQSRSEQREYLKNVELAQVLDKREERSQAAGREFRRKEVNKRPASESGSKESKLKRQRTTSSGESSTQRLESVLGSIF
jgi:ESF2/ABP1 family protein